MHQGHRERLRNRYAKNSISALEEHEILELLLCYVVPRKDVNPLAHSLLNQFESLAGVIFADRDQLAHVEGVGAQTALFLTFVGDVFKKLDLSSLGKRPKLNTPQIAAEYVRHLFLGKKVEEFYALFLDNQQQLIQCELISVGNHAETIVDPRKVVKLALLHGAAYVILAHNHPGGVCKPSSADIALTEQFDQIFNALSIVCAEHIIYTDQKCYAIKTKRRLDNNSHKSAKESYELTDAYQLARYIKSLDASSLDSLLSELDMLDENPAESK